MIKGILSRKEHFNVSERKNQKIRTSMWLNEDTIKECDSNLAISECRNRSEYITKAIEFYNGFLHAKNNTSYLTSVITSTVEGIIANTENRLARNQFKVAVELNTLSKLAAIWLGADEQLVQRIRLESIDEVKRVNGIIKFNPTSKE